MSVYVMGLVWKDPTITDQSLAITLLALADHAQDDGSSVYPSISTLAKKTRQSERSAQRKIQELIEADYIICVRQEERHRPREYRINMLRVIQGCQSVTPGDLGVPNGGVRGDKTEVLGVTNGVFRGDTGVTRSVSTDPSSTTISTDPSSTPPISSSNGKSLPVEIAYWNSKPDLTKAVAVSPKRLRTLNERRRDEFWRDHWKEAIDRISVSPFCLGKVTDWKAHIDWFLQPDVVAKTMEGRYDARNKPAASESSDDAFNLWGPENAPVMYGKLNRMKDEEDARNAAAAKANNATT